MQDLVGTLQEDTKEMAFSNARSGWCTLQEDTKERKCRT
jgi:hypothetical protein